jgi:hypothetical protein
MTIDGDRQARLEQLIGLAVRDLPLRSAPITLEARVRAEIGRRAALSWWRSGFNRWPLAAKILFAAVLAALVGIVIVYGPAADRTAAHLGNTLDEFASGWLAVWRALASVGRGLGALGTHMASTGWIEAAAVAVGTMYLACVGLGAATYRVLHLRN